MTEKFPLKKSFVAFLDILGFSQRFPYEKDSCIELISIFTEHNGTYFDRKIDNERQIRVSALSFSDNIALSIPVEINPACHTDEFYMPLISFLHAISFFSYEAMAKGYFIRGAIAYGETYHTASVVAGEPFIEAVKYEKIANFPRIVFSPSALSAMEKLYQQHFYGWDPEKIRTELHLSKDSKDNTAYFDWINFYKNKPDCNLQQTKKLEISNIIINAKKKLETDILATTENEILKKLNWMKNYIDNADHI